MSRLLFLGLTVLLCLGCENKKAALQAPAGEFARGQVNKAAGAAPADAALTERKIVYTAKLELVVASLDEARGQLDALLAEVKGYVAKSDETGRAGGVRAAGGYGGGSG